jgi:hypothetical protein
VGHDVDRSQVSSAGQRRSHLARYGPVSLQQDRTDLRTQLPKHMVDIRHGWIYEKHLGVIQLIGRATGKQTIHINPPYLRVVFMLPGMPRRPAFWKLRWNSSTLGQRGGRELDNPAVSKS